MNDLIEALQIFAKYTDTKYPTHCEHDVLYVMAPTEGFSEEDIQRLNGLRFFIGDELGEPTWMSYRFGSA